MAKSTEKACSKAGSRAAEAPRLSRLRKPQNLPAEDWQRELRRQFGSEQRFGLENLGDEPIFSEFSITNPDSRRRYRVVIRGAQPGDNHCSRPDFATNDLGTCKHIECMLAQLAARPGGKSALASGFRGTFSELYLDYCGPRRVRLRRGDDFPSTLQAPARRLFDATQGWSMPRECFAELPAFIDSVRAARHELRCQEDALAFVAEVHDAEVRRQILAAAYPLGANSTALATLLKVEMYPYQRHGALFAAQAGRALIGDEMGLGKTVQAIAAIDIFARHFGAERLLVVCPTSLKHRWEREIARFTERRATVIGGLRTVRQQRYAQGDFCKIANYETVSRDLDLIDAWAPDVVIVDEAQRIKNWNTIAARALERIDSRYAVVLTGTPLENRLEELISIVQFVDQHRLGPTWRLLDRHQQRDERGRVIGYRDLHTIGDTLAPILLRRRKAEVLEQLPARVDNTLFMPMSALQAQHHEENREIVARIVSQWRRTGYLSEKDQLRLHCSLQNMRMACNSSFLIDHETDGGYKDTVDRVAGAMDSPGTIAEESSSDTAPLNAIAPSDDEGATDGDLAGPVAAETVDTAMRAVAPREPARETPPPTVGEAVPTGGAADPWAPLLAAGAQLLGELAAVSQGERESPWVQTDSETGQRYLKLPVPDPQTVRRLAEALPELLGGRP